MNMRDISKLKDFLNTAGELHALVIGWGEIVAPWPPRWRRISRSGSVDLAKEYHYYQLGRALGVFTWVLIIALVKSIFA